MTREEYFDKLKQYRETVERGLDALLPESGDDMPLLLRRAMRYSLTAGGKRLRPVLLLATLEMLGADAQRGLTLACALEMIHTYSLIHDDLPGMDDDALRRGKPTNHIVFGAGQAILAGDGLLTYAFECALRHACALSGAEAMRELRATYMIASAAGVNGMVAGQCADLACEKAAGRDMAGIVNAAPATPDEMLRYIHMRKTGRLLMAPFEAACELADADADTKAKLMGFARPFGLLFQVMDDYLDVCGDSKALGKSVGKDKDSGKLTYVSLYGVDGTLKVRDELAQQAGAALDALPNAEFLRYELNAMAYRDR